MTHILKTLSFVCFLFCGLNVGNAQMLERQLLQEPAEKLAAAARESGDSRRGAILFHQVHVGCVKCHSVDGSGNSLGPDLTKLADMKDATDEHVIQSILKPSERIRKGYETVTVVTVEGKTHTGLLISRDAAAVILRNPAKDGQRTMIAVSEIEDVVAGKVSIMPAGITNQLVGRQQFLDLARYVLDIRDGGLDAARKLQPPPGLITFRLPDYEKNVDHAGLINALDNQALKRGEKIYNRLCINCHGDLNKPGSLPTALRFAEGKFRSGGDPYTMYKTLTHGFGLMVPQTWMVPKQKYDVVHYIRETYVRRRNPAQYAEVTEPYLAGLPPGDTFGPEPVEYAPWSDMNYGPSMINTFEVGSNGKNFAYKGIAVRLDAGPGGVSKGKTWAIFDHDTMRLAAAWIRPAESTASGFINWRGIHFDGRHNAHPQISGDLQFQNPSGPGWANPANDSFEDDQRVVGRDDRRYGPLPREWAKYRGLYTVGDRTIVEYTIADTPVLERLKHLQVTVDEEPVDVFVRNMSIGPQSQQLTALVATHPDSAALKPVTKHAVVMSRGEGAVAVESKEPVSAKFDGRSYVQISDADALNMTTGDFSIVARIRTKANGTIFSKAKPTGEWVPNGKSLFVRGGHLTYDIGWVGAVVSRRRVNDGKYHNVAMTWNHRSGKVSLYIDGEVDRTGSLKPKRSVSGHVAKIGFSAGNFPTPSFFTGDIPHVSFFRKELTAEDIAGIDNPVQATKAGAIRAWCTGAKTVDGHVADIAGKKLPAVWKRGVENGTKVDTNVALVSGLVGSRDGFAFSARDQRLCLQIPKDGDTRHVAVWTAKVSTVMKDSQLRSLTAAVEDRLQAEDLTELVKQPAPSRWPEVLTTQPILGPENGPFAIDVLSTPKANPWFCRLRLTGHDFFDDGDRVAVCTWDGDVWLVSGLKSLNQSGHRRLGDGAQRESGDRSASTGISPDTAHPNDDSRRRNTGDSPDVNGTVTTTSPQLKWKRIASGLFQPLGLKIVAGDIYLTCRDQLIILRDRNGDGETDFYECFNSDHQVTEHFHEFAMGLQRDEVGNFYYAKSARHALKAIVPHHGTLLRIPSDGSRTDILANGFRAANGVCLNPDGTFIVTDQEGHWNPKNRINWVKEGGFYGNMFGYHDVTDASDEAMQQPLCWITNAFDRSPAELMWVKNESWGPLNGSLLNLSYGYGKVYVVPHENVDGQMQGGMCQLPIAQFPTGIVRGRISPQDNGLYLTGMFAWASSQQAQEGGFYRLRYTGKPSYMPVGLQASGKQVHLTFTDAIDTRVAQDTGSYAVKVWSLKRTASYGSKHYDEHAVKVVSAKLSDDGNKVTLTIPDLAPTWCMEIKCRLKSRDGESFERVIHNTIHRLK